MILRVGDLVHHTVCRQDGVIIQTIQKHRPKFFYIVALYNGQLVSGSSLASYAESLYRIFGELHQDLEKIRSLSTEELLTDDLEVVRQIGLRRSKRSF